MKDLIKKLTESFLAVLPVTVLAIILALTATDIKGSVIGLFAVGAFLVIIGMTLFSLGADLAMMPIGNNLGASLSKSGKIVLSALLCLIIGIMITIAEPDLLVLSKQLQSQAIIYVVAAGIGLFLAISFLRTKLRLKLQPFLIASYGLVFLLALFVPKEYVALSFDSGGITTGPITVPFLMAIGIGFASVRGGKTDHDNTFGSVALCTVGPIITVLVMGLFTKTEVSYTAPPLAQADTFGKIIYAFWIKIPYYLKEVGIALAPIVFLFFAFQIFSLKLPKTQIIRICIGLIYTYLGLTIFLTAVNVGFIPMGSNLGKELASSSYSWMLIPAGMLMGCFIVLAEPAVHVLNAQVEQITGGSISKKSMMISLATGVSLAAGLAMTRVLTGMSIWYVLTPVYAISVILSFFVPPMFTNLAFDSGGVASGPISATFLMPMAIGGCIAKGGNLFTDAFGLVAFVSMTPLITIQILGLVYKIKLNKQNIDSIKAIEESTEKIVPSEEFVEFIKDAKTEIIDIEEEESDD